MRLATRTSTTPASFLGDLIMSEQNASRREFLLATGGGLAASMTPGSASTAAAASSSVQGGEVVLPRRRVPVLAEADVIVCGGGTAGVSAACCAARHGASVILLERWPSVGGMATNALVNIWHTCDRQKQVIYGFTQEAIDRAGPFIHRYANYPKRYESHWFDPEGMRVVLHQMLDESGVRTLCGLQATEPLVENDRIRGVLVDTKRGRKAVLGHIVIDATGDGDVAANAGVGFDFGRPGDGLVQGMTMMFEVRGIDEQAMRAAGREAGMRVVEMMRERRDQGNFPQFNDRHAQHYLRTPNNGLYNLCPANGNPLDEEELTRLSWQARQDVFEYLDLWRQEMPGFAKAKIAQMGFGIGIRESRRIRGLKALDAKMVLSAAKQPDAVGHGFWMIDIHDPKGTGYTTHSDQKASMMVPPGQSYHIPLGMCLNRQIPNLAMAGRCASCTHEGLASVRLQSHCMVMGQGVGTAAALALAAGVDMAQVDLAKLQATLRKDGVYLEDVPATATSH